MKQLIYKFLDDYFGSKATCEFMNSPLRMWTDTYEVVSDSGVLILWFRVKNDKVIIYRSDSLCKKIEGYYGIDKEESWKYVRDWFGQKHNIKFLSDLLKMIPQTT